MAWMWYNTFVTIYEKPGIWDFFVNVELCVWLISSTIELPRVQVSDQLCASLWRYSALVAIAAHSQIEKLQKSIKWTWVERFEMNVKIEQ